MSYVVRIEVDASLLPGGKEVALAAVQELLQLGIGAKQKKPEGCLVSVRLLDVTEAPRGDGYLGR